MQTHFSKILSSIQLHKCLCNWKLRKIFESCNDPTNLTYEKSQKVSFNSHRRRRKSRIQRIDVNFSNNGGKGVPLGRVVPRLLVIKPRLYEGTTECRRSREVQRFARKLQYHAVFAQSFRTRGTWRVSTLFCSVSARPLGVSQPRYNCANLPAPLPSSPFLQPEFSNGFPIYSLLYADTQIIRL